MRQLTRLEAVVLGLLCERPAHGYELRSRLGPGLPPDRLINDGVLYPLLGRLERRGLATASEQRGGGRRRRVYSATGAGDAAFREWLLGDRDEGAAVGYELFIDHPLTKLLFASRLNDEELTAKIDSLIAAARDRLAALEAVPRVGEDAAAARIGGALLALGRAREVALIAELERLCEELST